MNLFMAIDNPTIKHSCSIEKLKHLTCGPAFYRKTIQIQQEISSRKLFTRARRRWHKNEAEGNNFLCLSNMLYKNVFIDELTIMNRKFTSIAFINGWPLFFYHYTTSTLENFIHFFQIIWFARSVIQDYGTSSFCCCCRCRCRRRYKSDSE